MYRLDTARFWNLMPKTMTKRRVQINRGHATKGHLPRPKSPKLHITKFIPAPARTQSITLNIETRQSCTPANTKTQNENTHTVRNELHPNHNQRTRHPPHHLIIHDRTTALTRKSGTTTIQQSNTPWRGPREIPRQEKTPSHPARQVRRRKTNAVPRHAPRTKADLSRNRSQTS